uniref:Uncharacterized protein n=2 Tax=Toxoplasma gondii TaxID=5811 RepID=A0A0F7VBW8_TOXGV|nr:TPA: hypothetical protein BN1205_096335 [Toxoplasma gondii VEG]
MLALSNKAPLSPRCHPATSRGTVLRCSAQRCETKDGRRLLASQSRSSSPPVKTRTVSRNGARKTGPRSASYTHPASLSPPPSASGVGSELPREERRKNAKPAGRTQSLPPCASVSVGSSRPPRASLSPRRERQCCRARRDAENAWTQGERDRDRGGNSTHRSREGWSPDARRERVSPVPEEAFCFSDSSPHLHCHHACHPRRQREARAASASQSRLDLFHHRNLTFKIPPPASSENPSSRASAASRVSAAPPSPASTSAYVYSTRLDGCFACSPRARREQYEQDLKFKGRVVPRTRAREIRDACAKAEREETVRRRERERTLREKKDQEHADVSGTRKRQETPDSRGRDQTPSVCPERRRQRRSPTGEAAATAHEREDSAWVQTEFVYDQEDANGCGNYSAPLPGSDKAFLDSYKREARLRSASSRDEVRREEETRVPDEERERAEKKAVPPSTRESRCCHKDTREKEGPCRSETGKRASARAPEAFHFLRNGEGDAGKGSEEASKNAAVSSSTAPRERTHCMQKTTHPPVQSQLCFIPRRLGSAITTARAIHEQGGEKRGGRCEETLESLKQTERRNRRTTVLRQTAGPRAASRSGRRPFLSDEKAKHSPHRGRTELVCRLDGSNSVDRRSVSPRRPRWERGKDEREQSARNKSRREAAEEAESRANGDLDRKQAEAVSRAIQSPVSVNVVEKNAKKLLHSMQRELGHRAPSLLPVQAKLQQLVEVSFSFLSVFVLRRLEQSGNSGHLRGFRRLPCVVGSKVSEKRRARVFGSVERKSQKSGAFP